MIFDRPTRNVFCAGRRRVANFSSGAPLGRRPIRPALALLVTGLQRGSFLGSFVFD